jgi:hypothetical protein
LESPLLETGSFERFINLLRSATDNVRACGYAYRRFIRRLNDLLRSGLE